MRMPRNDYISITLDIEESIREYIENTRKKLKLETQFDNNIEIVLSQALCNYELERLCGCTFGQNDFQLSLKNCVVEG